MSGIILPYNRHIVMPVMPTSLDRRRVAELKSSASLAELERRAQNHVPRGFQRELEKRAQTGVAIIAELKKASPSRGLIRADFDPEKLAGELEDAGAAALSVLTDEEFFQGSLENLRCAASSTRLPCLRKDFVVDEFQIVETRANCGDAILLIVGALSDGELRLFTRRAAELELDVLCEVHDEEELRRAQDLGCALIGVNNRDLRTFKVDIHTALRLADRMPKNATWVAESGIQTGTDIAGLRAAGYQAFLIGESLMKSSSPGQALRELLSQTPVPTMSVQQ
jgi:indole-3-glycerol phosphate synthase